MTTHHAVLFAYGAQADRPLGVPGEAKAGGHGAAEFVGWYNGHPDYRDCRFDLSAEVAVIVGQGNVAADLARILAQPVDRLRSTDIAAHALNALSASRVRVIHIVGRRGAAQAKFTPKELQELTELPECTVELAEDELFLGPGCLRELADPNNSVAAKNVALFRGLKARRPAETRKRIVFHFLKTPVELAGASRVERIVLERNTLQGAAFAQAAVGTGALESIDCGLVFRSIGYRGRAIEGVPFDESRGIIPSVAGRVEGRPGMYVTGWIKRGPSGLIGTNRGDSVATVSALLADVSGSVPLPKPGSAALVTQLEQRGVRVVRYSDWLRINECEVERGRVCGRLREKITAVAEMLDVLLPEVGKGSSLQHR
jgi:ferredoxin--NADP+ reductase